MSKPSEDYRQHLRDALRLFATLQQRSAILPRGWRSLPGRGINHLPMDVLEAGYRLVMGMDPPEPADYRRRRP